MLIHNVFFYFIKYKKGGGDISKLNINISEIKKNIKFYKNRLNKNQIFCFVAKANCYGYGYKLCKYFNDDVDYFAVSSYYEFSKIKKYATKPILILDTIYDKNILLKLIKNNAELTISNLKSLNQVMCITKEYDLIAKVHIAVNTGMNRLGFKKVDEIIKLCEIIKKTQNIKIIGIFSHYFQANDRKIDENQIKCFKKFILIFRQKLSYMPKIHICSTDGSLVNNYGDMVRIGYGIYSDKFYETITLKSKIIDIQYLDKNEVAGYNGIFAPNKTATIAVVGIGYGDGIFRNIVNKGYVLINDTFAKIVAVCMDTIIVDITNIRCNLNDDVVLIGKDKKNRIYICDIANWCDTIGYEIIVRLSDRIERNYIVKSK